MRNSTSRFGLAMAVLVLVVGVAGPTRAGSVIESPWTGTFNGYYSTTQGQQIADYFVMTSTSNVQAITWKGHSVNDSGRGSLDGVTSMNFKMRFYLDTDSLPVQARLLDHTPALDPFYEANVTASVSPTGNESPDHQSSLYQFAANLGVPLTLNSGQTYWISILGDSPSKEFGWALGAAGSLVFRPYPLPPLTNSDGTAWYENANLSHAHVTFALFDSPLALPDPGPSPNPVPEPAPIALIGATIPIGLGYTWRRRKGERRGSTRSS